VGTFSVRRDGAELADAEIGSRKSRTLLKLLAVEHPRLVPTDRIIEILWADSPPAAAIQNVATLVSRLRGVLGAGAILGGRDGYRLAGEPEVSVDLDTAGHYCEHAARTLPTSPAIALVAAGHAADLLAGDKALADEPYATWADPARAELRSLLRRARLLAAEAALASSDPDSAARYAEAAMAADSLDEAAHRSYMAASAAAGEPTKALLAYAALRERLREELGVAPSQDTQELHLCILRGSGVYPGGSAPRTPRPATRLAVTDPPGREGLKALHSQAPRSSLRSPREPPWSAGAEAGVKEHAEPLWSAGAGAGVKNDKRGGRFARRGGRGDSGLVGREVEAGRLLGAWSRAVGGDGSLVMLVGEAGIGKTALAERLAAEAERDGGTVLRTRCYEAERSLFLQPLTEAARSVAGRLPAAELRRLLGEHGPALAVLMPEFAALLGPAPSWHGSPDT
jgi:DNA-binding SARP family transcriptional activator